ncbi:MAG: ParB/RepB/Spo0J family partition protein [Bacilli bacterium]|nr:ParB/RepB/Spo0J family partition protein [Bacilli bacterium]
MDETKEVRQIPIEDIIPNRFQPRINFDEKALNELAESIKQHGIIQPLVLRPLGDKFEIIAGERRFKAATLAGLSTVPGIVTEMDDNTSAEVALIENVQRKDLSAIEEAKSYKNMLERSNITQEELAKKMGLSQSTIANKLRLLNLCDEVQNALSQEKISERHARALLAISDKDEQIKWLNRIINERLTVRQLDLAIKDEQKEETEFEEDIPKVNINPDIDSIINNASDINANVKPVENNATNDVLTDNVAPTEIKPGKFFNYLEDEEVNMNVSTEPEEEKQPVNDGMFNFTPEFAEASDNQPEQPTEEIDSLDFEPTQSVQPDEPIYNEETITNDINNQVVNEQVTPDIPQDDQVDVVNNSQETSVSNEEPEFIFDDEDDDEGTTSAKPVTDDVKVEPIPVMEGEGITDPVSYYDTLDPNFMDKVKEFIGLDLKNAISSYRNVTNDLIASGFNVTIDETDLEDKYKIEININKD